MSAPPAVPVAQHYDRTLRYARDRRLPAGAPTPQPTAAWPPENLALLETYRGWLLDSGASPAVVRTHYLPMAGHVLGLTLKPHTQLDPDADLTCALDYVRAKQLSAEWREISRNALLKFRQFLRQQRGQREVAFHAPDLSRYQAALPGWFVEQLSRYQHLRQAGWRPERLAQAILRFWSGHVRLWRGLFAHGPVCELAHVKRQHLLDYMDHRLALGYSPKGINADLRSLRGFLLFLQDQGWRVPQALLRLRGLKEPDSLPRFLSDEQVAKLRADLEGRAAAPPLRVPPRDTRLDRAAFHLLWQGGLRLGELEELRLPDLDLAGRKLMVRQGKGCRDRAVFLADSALSALKAYLAMRGAGPSDHVFLYRAEPVNKDLLRCRIKYAGERAGVKVSPHALRHTFATQLLNAGCPITSIQKLLGHQRLRSTLVYARVHDRTVAHDYYTAMSQIEKRLRLTADASQADQPRPARDAARERLLQLASELARPQLRRDARQKLVRQMRRLIRTEMRAASSA